MRIWCCNQFVQCALNKTEMKESEHKSTTIWLSTILEQHISSFHPVQSEEAAARTMHDDLQYRTTAGSNSDAHPQHGTNVNCKRTNSMFLATDTVLLQELSAAALWTISVSLIEMTLFTIR